MSKDIVQLLPDHVANQIAAGEVVQRPASVVKELMENAIDAGAKHITLIIKDAGKTLIQVSDDGTGMSVTDARLAFERHATSKIHAADDLFHLQTKGFRGEALASIAAIAHVFVKTRRADDEIGTVLRLKGSEVESQEPAVVPKGTVIEVKNLFYNVPARRNFLKSERVERKHIVDEFERVALAHPDVSFDFYRDESELFSLPAGNERQRLVAVFGRKMNEKLVPIKEETDLVKIEGFVGKPEFAKRTKGEQFFFVNRRFVKSGYLHHAIKTAFEGLLKERQYPTYFLFLEIDPETIDINIHPTKTEIKFEDEHAIYTILKSAVKHSLGQFNVTPTLDFKHRSEFDTPYEYRSKAPKTPRIEVDRDFNPFSDEGEKPTFNWSGGASKRQKSKSWEGLYVGLEDQESEDSFSKVEFESDANTGSLFSNDPEELHSGIFQLQKKYVVSSLKESMLVIHQHRAHYRILYEEFLKNITVERGLTQQLLFPLVISLNRQEIRMLKEIQEMLELIGFHFSEIGEEEVQIGGVPGVLSEREISSVLDRVLADYERDIPDNESEISQNIARILAKNTAVKTGATLNSNEQLSIINRLFACKMPNLSPENKTVFVRLNAEDLDKRFI